MLYGAGHPRLAFELDTFGILQPRHWEIDQDYKDRKQEYVPAKAWLVGQAVLGREIVEAISSGKRSKYGTFPELSLFDCFSCHHSLTEDQWKQRTYEKRPGELRLNLAPLIMVREGMATINPTLSKELDAGIKELHDSYIKDGAPKGVANLKSIFTKVIAASESVTADTKTLGAILKSLISFGARTPYLKYELAEQLGMGAQAILASSPELGKAHKAGIDKIFATLNSSEAFAPDAFTEACKEFMKTL